MNRIQFLNRWGGSKKWLFAPKKNFIGFALSLVYARIDNMRRNQALVEVLKEYYSHTETRGHILYRECPLFRAMPWKDVEKPDDSV